MVFHVYAINRQTLDSLQQVIVQNSSNESKIDAYYQLANLYAQTGSPEMWSHAYQGQQLARKINNLKGIANFDLLIAENHAGILNNDSLFFLLKEANQLFAKLEMKRELANTYNKLGVLFEKQSNHSLATKCYYKALFLYQENNDLTGIGNVKNDIGLLCRAEGNYTGAYYFFKQAIAIAKQINDLNILSKAYNNMAICKQEQGFAKESLNYLGQTLFIEERKKDLDAISITYNNIGAVFLELKDFTLAKVYLFKALETELELNNAQTLPYIYNNIANVYSGLKNQDSAFYFINQGINAAKNNGDVQSSIESYSLYADLLVENKDYKQALFYINLKNNLADSLNKVKQNIALLAMGDGLNLKNLNPEDLEMTSSFLGITKNNAVPVILCLILLMAFLVLLFRHIDVFKKNKYLLGKQRKIEVQNKILQVKNIEILQAKEAAEELANIKSQFVNSISNEIRSPINDIIGASNLLTMDDPKPSQLDNLKVLNSSIENLLLLVNNVLDFGKLEAGKIQLENIDFDLRNLVEDVRELFVIKAMEKNIDLHLEFDENIPSVLKGDPLRINQLLINLVNNAIRHTDAGFVKIEISVQMATINHSLIHFSVTDTGIGIPLAKQTQIFQNFTQADSNTTRKFGGTGIGLSICKRILENLNSKLQMESIVGKGSRFHFAINFEVSRNASIGKSSRTASFEDAIQGKRVLVVEDNMMNIMVMRQFLQKWGVITEIALNGREAISRLVETNFDAILMDIHMPEMNGIEATKIIRALPDERKKNIPIIALTAENELQFRQQVYEVGMNDYIFKPFNPDDFKERLGYALFNAAKKNA